MYKLKNLTKFSNILFVLVITFLFSITGFVFAEMPRIVGITDGSVYSNSVRVLFYPNGSNAQYKIDGSAYNNCAFGDKFTSDGSYTLEVTHNSDTKIINFLIDNTLVETVYKTKPYLNIPENKKVKLEIQYEKEYSSGFDPLMAVWLEDLNGNFLKTLYVSQVPAGNYLRYVGGEVARAKAIPYWASRTCIHQSGDYYIADPYSNDPEGVDTVTGATTINYSNHKFTIETFVNSALLPENVNIVYETNRTATPDTNSLVYRTEINLLTGTNNTPLVFGSYNSIDPVGFSDVNSANFLNEDFSGANSDQYNDLKLQITKIISVNVTPAKKPLSSIYLLLQE